MIEARVAKLEKDLEAIRTSLQAIEVSMRLLPSAADASSLKADVARLDGRVSQLPTAWAMFTAIVTTVVATWGAGAAIVFTLLRYAKP